MKRSDVPVWFHVYSTKNHPTHADSFSKGWGDTRFAPIRADDGSWLHTYYVASTPECAYIESVLHEIPLNPLHFNPDLPTGFCDVIAAMMDKNPDKRTPTAAAVVMILVTIPIMLLNVRRFQGQDPGI